jgi:hypothetical protein
MAGVARGGSEVRLGGGEVVVAKYDDHLPLYRQQEICARPGVHLAQIARLYEIARTAFSRWTKAMPVRGCGPGIRSNQVLENSLLAVYCLYSSQLVFWINTPHAVIPENSPQTVCLSSPSAPPISCQPC